MYSGSSSSYVIHYFLPCVRASSRALRELPGLCCVLHVRFWRPATTSDWWQLLVMARVNLLWVAALSIFCATFVLAEVKDNAFGNVVFLESGKQEYLRSKHPDSWEQETPFTREETAAAVSVLLGGLPPHLLSAKSSAKLDSLLSPNLFKRPRAVFMLNIGGVSTDSIDTLAENAFGSPLHLKSLDGDSDQQPFELSGESVALKSLDDWGYGRDAEKFSVSLVLEKLESVVSFVKGSFERGAKVGSVVLRIPLPDAADFSMSLDLTKDAELSYALDLLSLTSSSSDLASRLSLAGEQRPILFMGSFNSLELFEKRSARQTDAKKLFLYTAGQVMDHMREMYSDQLVGVYTLTSSSLEHMRPIVTVSLSRFSRVLVEDALAPSPSSANQTSYDEEVKKLKSRSIVVAVTIILLLASGLGSIFLFFMRLTRDTLLYANVKLD